MQMNALLPWQERLRILKAEQDRIAAEERARLAALAPPPEPVPLNPFPQSSGLARVVAATLARDREAAEALRARPAPPPDPGPQVIDAAYAEAFSKKMINASASAIAKIESRKQLALDAQTK